MCFNALPPFASPRSGLAVVWGGEEKGSRQRDEIKYSRGHWCGLSPAPGQVGMALLKTLTAPKLAGIAEKNAQEEKVQHKESVCHVEKAHSRAPSSATAMEACGEFWGYICTRWLSFPAPSQCGCTEIPASAGWTGDLSPARSSRKGNTAHHRSCAPTARLFLTWKQITFSSTWGLSQKKGMAKRKN